MNRCRRLSPPRSPGLSKRSCVMALVILVTTGIDAQEVQDHSPRRGVSIAAGLGVSLVNATDVVDYVNSWNSGSTRFDDFTSTGEFFGALAIPLNDEFGLKLEYAYLLKTYTIPQPLAPDLSFSYTIHMPTL